MKRALALILVAFLPLAGCAPADDATAPGDDSAGAADGKADGASPPPGTTHLLQLDSGVFPPTSAHPSALVYLPQGFDPTPPLNVIVYIHGFYNCVTNVVRASGKSCSAHGTVRNAYNLEAQLEAAHKNVMLLVPEVAFDQANPDPGKLAVEDGFKNLLAETLTKVPEVSGLTVDDVGEVIVASHSGGYKAAAGIALHGGVPVSEIFLLDSLYGSTADYDAWVNMDLSSFSGATPMRRLAIVYTGTGGTLTNSQAMARRAAGWMADVDATAVVNDPTTATWTDASFAHGLLFKRTGLAHDGVPKYYFGKLVASSALPDQAQ
jgi:hypothetical protein